MYQTKNLGLNITEIEKDKLDAFSFKTDLGDNFEAIDSMTLSHRNITNCLLEVPQDIKLEIVDGSLILREGSKVYIPNGFEADGVTKKFDLLTIQNDISKLGDTPRTSMSIITHENNILSLPPLFMHSGSEAPTNFYGSAGYAVWYDTTNNALKWTNNQGISWFTGSLPIGLQTETINGYTSIDQVFNGFGYVGSTVFALPGVKGLIPNGRNEDDSLSNIILECSSVYIRTFGNSANETNGVLGLGEDTISLLGNSYSHNFKENRNYNSSNIWAHTSIGAIALNSGIITSFQPKKPFRAVDYNDYSTKIAELEAKIQALQTAVEALQG